jgi:hypothetical protein
MVVVQVSAKPYLTNNTVFLKTVSLFIKTLEEDAVVFLEELAMVGNVGPCLACILGSLFHMRKITELR